MKQKACHKLVYKIDTRMLKKAKWDLTMDLNTAMHDYPDVVVALNDSQVLRWIDEINGITDVNSKVREIQRRIRLEKKKPRSRVTAMMIRELYRNLYEMQFVKDYVCVVMKTDKDYDRANQGFKINGIEYRRFLGTSGGIKNSTIVYVNSEIYPELKKRVDNGRKMDIPLVPAKLEAYQALVCSGSTPLPDPKGVIVVKDCITHFTDDIILINDQCDGEPIMTEEKDYPIEHNGSDGCGLMLPSYSKKVNEYLNGDGEHTISGMNTRWAWTKGMVYTFDFVEFAKEVAGTYEITDVWGDKRDVRDAEIILTESMLKLWDFYDNWENYERNCIENHYQFSTPKITPDKLENVRDTNYQYLQSYHFTDEEIEELCKPTFDEINEVLGGDYRKSLVFLAGFNLDENMDYQEFSTPIQALMIDPNMINDPFILRKVWNMIAKRIEMAKRGAVRVNANFAMISGDLYALCENMFGLPVRGLLSAGEIYHKYWIDKESDEVVCFRSPMTCHNNIRKVKLNKSQSACYWYRYIDTAIILNVWDTVCEATNGSDFDGDTFMCTDNQVLLNNTLNSPTIICLQKKADKKIVEEQDIIEANKLGFNDEIGVVTNHATSMIERQSAYPEDSNEYKTLAYRIMCSQMYQQNVIDRIKGIVAKPMPSCWYNSHDCENDSMNHKIVAAKKPYFMNYVYPNLRKQYTDYIRNNDRGAIRRFQRYGIESVNDLANHFPRTKAMSDFLLYYEKNMPTGNNPCVVNKICWLAEKEFSGFTHQKSKVDEFDYTVLKSNVGYTKHMFNEVKSVYHDYLNKLSDFQKRVKTEKLDGMMVAFRKKQLEDIFRMECEKICTNEDELCDIVIDICYQKMGTRQFAWDICGETIIQNLLRYHNNSIRYPEMTDVDGDFTYCGKNFVMKEMKIMGDENDYSE